MPAPVEIDFTVGGIREVLRAFDTIENRAERAERTGVTTANTGAQQRVSTTEKEVRSRSMGFEKLAETIKKQEAAATKAAEAEANRRNKFYSEEDGNRLKSLKKTADELAAIEKKITKDKEREQARQLEDIGKASRDRLRVLEQESAQAMSIAKREAAQAESIAKSSAARQQTFERRLTMRYGRSVGSAVTGSLGRTAGAIGMLAGAALGVGGSFAVAGALRDEMSFESAVAQASNEAYDPNDTTGKRSRARTSPALIAAMARAVQGSTNIDKTDVAKAFKEYVGKSSDVEGLMQVNSETGTTNMEEIAKIAKGTGGDLQQLVGAAAAMKASSPTMSTTEMMRNLLGVVAAGKKGNLPIEELAGSIPQIVAGASLFSGSTTENQNKLLGLAQLVGPKAGNAAETAEAIKRMGESVMRQGPGHGMTASMIYTGGDATKGLLDPATLVANVFRAAGGRADISEKILGREGFKVFEALQDTYTGGVGGQAGAAGVNSGARAVESKIREFESVSYTHQNVNEDFANAMNTTGEQLDKVLKDLKEELERDSLPAFKKFVKLLVDHHDDIAAFVKGLGELAQYVASNPLEAAIRAMSAKMILDVGSAAIGTAIKNQLMRVLHDEAADGGGPLGAGKFVGAGGVVGALSAAAAIGVVSVAVIAIGEGIIDSLVAKLKGDQDKQISEGLKIQNLSQGLVYNDKTGTFDKNPEEAKKQLLALQDEINGRVTKAIEKEGIPHASDIPGQIATSGLSKEGEKTITSGQDALDRIARILESIDHKTVGGPGNGTPGPGTPVNSVGPLRGGLAVTPTNHPG